MPGSRKSTDAPRGRKTNANTARGKENKEYKTSSGQAAGEKKPRFSKPRSFDKKESGFTNDAPRERGSFGGERKFKKEESSDRKDNRDSRNFDKKEGGFSKGKSSYAKTDNDPREKRERAGFKKDSNSRKSEFAQNPNRPIEKSVYEDRSDKKKGNFGSSSREKNSDSRERRSDRKDTSGKRSFSKDADSRGTERRFKKDDSSDRKSFSKEKPSTNKRFDENESWEKKSFSKDNESEKGSFNKEGSYVRSEYKGKSDKGSFSKQKSFDKPKSPTKNEKKNSLKKEEGQLRLNRYLSNSGVCSRREADEYISAGAVSVNGKVITEMGYQVMPGDMVKYGGAILNPEKPVYLLLNKPKGFITTVSDPRDRKTVMSLIAGACRERIVPVGRLDRNTTGLLLFTNDGDMLKKLTHPKHGVNKIYHVETDIPVKKADITKMLEGVELEDGIAKADNVSYVDAVKTKKEIGIELHSGKNRIVRRMVSSFGYEVITLDRVYFAGLTKKNLPRGHYRFLNEKEINILKMIS